MKTEKFNLNVLDLKGLFCDVLARHLNDGTLTREFVADMKKRGVLTDAKKSQGVRAGNQLHDSWGFRLLWVLLQLVC